MKTSKRFDSSLHAFFTPRLLSSDNATCGTLEELRARLVFTEKAYEDFMKPLLTPYGRLGVMNLRTTKGRGDA